MRRSLTLEKNINDQIPSLDKNQEIKERKTRFLCKCHWTPDKENLNNELHNMKMEINKLKNEKHNVQVKSVRYENDCKQLEKIVKNDQQYVNEANLLFKSQFDKSKNLQFQKIQKQKEEITELETQIQNCKKNNNYTKVKELEIQNAYYNQELKKLKQYLQQNTIQQKSQNNGESNKLQFQKEFKQQNQVIKKQKQQIEELTQKCQIEQSNNIQLQQQYQKKKERLQILEKQIFLRDQVSSPIKDIMTNSSRSRIFTIQNKFSITQMPKKQIQSMKEQCLQSHLQKLKYKEIVQSLKQIKQIIENDNKYDFNQPSKQQFIDTLQKIPFNFTIYKSKQLADYVFQQMNKGSILDLINQFLTNNNSQQTQLQSQLGEIVKCNNQFIEQIFLYDQNMSILQNDIFQIFKDCGLILSTEQFNLINKKLFNKQKKVQMINLQQLIFDEFIQNDMKSYKSSQKLMNPQEIVIDDAKNTKEHQQENQDIIINNLDSDDGIKGNDENYNFISKDQ